MNASAANADTLLRRAGSPLGTGKRRVTARLGLGGCNPLTYCNEYAFYFTRPIPGNVETCRLPVASRLHAPLSQRVRAFSQ